MAVTEDALNAGYFRTPSIAGDDILFVSEDDLWSVPRTGGVARRLTANLGPVGRALVSPDGELIAFTGAEEGHAEVYVMPADGGPATRVTYLGASTAVRGWTPDHRILFVSDARRPHAGDYHVWTVDPEGGQPEPLGVGPAYEVDHAPDGTGLVLGRHTIDPARWKRYRGGRRGDIWIDRDGKGTFRRLLRNVDGNLASPLWVGDRQGGRIYFLSDHEGIGNLYSVTPTGRGLKRHTDHGTYYARWAESDGRRIVYQSAAEIWTYDPETDVSERVDVRFHSPRIGRNRRFVDASKFIHSWNVHPDGHAVAVASRGKLFTMPLWEHAVRQYGEPDGVRYRLPTWNHDGSRLICVSDDGGDEALEVYSVDEGVRAKRLGRIDIGRALSLVASPTKDEVVVSNHRNELVWVNLRNNRSKVLDRSDHGPLDRPVFSPDGRYVAYSFAETARTRTIRLAEPSSGTTHTLTRPDFSDFSPAFDPEGRYLYFLSARVYDPVLDQRYFDYGFPRAVRPHLLTLGADEPSPFVPKPRGFGGPKRSPDEKDGAKDADQPLTEIDLDGIADRVLAFPVPEGRYTQIAGIKGKVLFTSFPVSGALGSDLFDVEEAPRGKLESYDLKELKHEPIASALNGFRLSADGSTLVYQAHRRLRAMRAGDKVDPKNDKEPPSRRSGWLDLKRIRPSVDPRTEYQQMFREAWRFQRQHFWVPDMSGVDWNEVYDRYLPLVDKVATRAEFSDLMWETLGELGTSHAYEVGGDYRPPPPYPVGQLACDLVLRGERWVIDHVVRGDSWAAQASSPLAAPGVGVGEGQTILAVNGQPTSPDVSPQSLLVNQRGVAVELLVGDGQGRSPRTVVVKTLQSETPARYREWVERNRAHVHEATNGRVGYVHIPDMGPRGYSEFHRYYNVEVERDGLIVDVRHNGGGHVSQIIIEKLARERIGYDTQRWGEPDPYPSDSPAGPLVCITNENAGSDGDIFTHVFKLKGLGPVVGKRTWGGVIGINRRHILVDNGMTTQPEYSFWFTDVGFGVENYGTDPTHDVDITPQDHAAGRDPQMESALCLMRQALRKHKPAKPDLRSRPRLELPSLPAREGHPKAKGKASKRGPKRASSTKSASSRKRAPKAKRKR